MQAGNYQFYLEALKEPFVKLTRLRFLNPDGSTAFAVDNDWRNERSGAFISDGTLTVNLQNGKRREADVTFDNTDGAFDYSVNRLWFGQEVALDEGMVLPQFGAEFYIQQGIFVLDTPEEAVNPGEHTITYHLTDKWANLDGTLYGNLESTYEVPVGTSIFSPITALLAEDRGNGLPVDGKTPIYTTYYEGKTQELPDGTTAALTDVPYTIRIDSDNGTIADVVLELAGVVNAWVGYDKDGRLRLEPSQDDILDTEKPVSWRFDISESNFIGATYTIKNTEVYNDYIVVGDLMDDYTQPSGRAQNTDPKSPTNVNIIGRKTFREQKAGYATDTMCEDLAIWMLKRSSVLQKAVSITCGQIFHLSENEIVEIARTDQEKSPVERYRILGFSRPLAGTGDMTINAVSVNDIISDVTVIRS